MTGAAVKHKRSVRTYHGMSGTSEHSIWGGMINRCSDPSNPMYHRYGGRGIKVCERWKTFGNFFADMGKRPSIAHSIDRYPDNDGNYEPSNCRWATRQQQARNKGCNHWVEFRCRKVVIQDLAAEFGIKSSTVNARIKRGWTVEQAATTPTAGNRLAKIRRPRHAKLNAESVAAIRALAVSMTTRELAAKFGVSVDSIQKVKSGKAWKNV